MATKKTSFSWNRVFDTSARVLAVLYTAIYAFFFAGEVIGEFVEQGRIDLSTWSTRDLVMILFGPVTFVVSTVLMFSRRKAAGVMLLSGACMLLAISLGMRFLSWGFFVAYFMPMTIIGIELLAVNSTVNSIADEPPKK